MFTRMAVLEARAAKRTWYKVAFLPIMFLVFGTALGKSHGNILCYSLLIILSCRYYLFSDWPGVSSCVRHVCVLHSQRSLYVSSHVSLLQASTGSVQVREG